MSAFADLHAYVALPRVTGLALSPDGQTLYTAWPLTAYDVATGKRIWRREEVRSVWALDVNAKGTLLALGDSQTQKNAFLVDAASGHTVATLRGHRDVVTDIRFSPDGTLVGSGSNDGELIVWDKWGPMVRDARLCRAPHHEGLRPRPEEARSAVSKDGAQMTRGKGTS